MNQIFPFLLLGWIYFIMIPCCAVLSRSVMSDSLWSHRPQPARLLCPWGFSRSGLPCPPPGDLPNPRIERRSPALQVDSLPSESPGKPNSTGVGSLSLLQGIFPTQDLNWGLLHCRCFTNWAIRESFYCIVNWFVNILLKVFFFFLYLCSSVILACNFLFLCVMMSVRVMLAS